MRINPINFNSFGQIRICNSEYLKLLAPYKNELEKITRGYDVHIQKDDGLFDAYDLKLEKHVPLCSLPVVTITPENNFHRVIPEMKFFVHPGAGEMQSGDGQAHEMINTIKKAIDFIG